MHELSVATQILEVASEHATERGGERIDRIEVTVGEASHVNPEQLATCLAAASRETMAAGAEFEVETVAPYAECDCGWDGEPEGLAAALAYAPDLTCPDCGTRLTLQRGGGCHLRRLSVTTPPDGDVPEQGPSTDDRRPRGGS